MTDPLGPTFEGIDPPLLDPELTAQFSSVHSNTTDIMQQASSKQTYIENLSLEDLRLLAAVICQSPLSTRYPVYQIVQTGLQSTIVDETHLNPSQGQPTPSHNYQLCGEIYPPKSAPNIISSESTSDPTITGDLLVEYSKVLDLFQADTTRIGDPSQTNTTSTHKSSVTRATPSKNPGDGGMQLSSGKLRVKYARRNFSSSQIEGLEATFRKHRFIKKDMREQLAGKLNLTEQSISYWFQNKRARNKPPITMKETVVKTSTG